MNDWTERDPGFARVFEWDSDRSVVFRGVQYPAVYVQAPEVPRTGRGVGLVFLGYHSDMYATVTGARQFLQLVTGANLGVPDLELNSRWFSGDLAAYERARRQIDGARRGRRRGGR